MNIITKKMLNRTRRLLGNGVFRDGEGKMLPIDASGEAAGEILYELIMANRPCMASRLGRTEFVTIRRSWFCRNKGAIAKSIGYVLGEHGKFWWEQQDLDFIQSESGVFPNDRETMEKFSQRYFDDIPLIDVLGAWSPGEAEFGELLGSARFIPLVDFEPFWHQQPWTRSLEGKSVLVIHPFADSIVSQYKNRKLLFRNPDTLPDFDLHVLKSVWSAGGSKDGWRSWFDVLDWMCGQMEKVDFEVVLIGAGAYGLPLAAHAKRMGKMAVHMGGALQLLFGIKGKRWDSLAVSRKVYNEYWTRPTEEETPSPDKQVEEGCYW